MRIPAEPLKERGLVGWSSPSAPRYIDRGEFRSVTARSAEFAAKRPLQSRGCGTTRR